MSRVRIRGAAGVILGAAVLAGISGCSKAAAKLDHPAKGPASTCADPQTLAQVKSIIFDNAAQQAGSANKLVVPELGRESTLQIPTAVLDGFDKVTQKTSCSGRAEIDFPATAASVIGTSQAASEIRYTAQPSADGAATVYMVYGADDLISGIASADLQAWRASATSGGAAIADAAPAQTTARGAAAPLPSAAEILRGDRGLQARDREVSALYQNALGRDATGQVRAEEEAALASRASCHSNACLQSWFDHREAALKAWQGS